MERLLSAREASELIGCSRWTLWKLAREGIVPVVRIGRSVKFDPEQLRVFIATGGTPKADALAPDWRQR